jgi:hypothetical protein
MPFCPECRAEYVAATRNCSDCRKALVDRLPVVPSVPDIRFVPLPGVPGRAYAEMVKHVLDRRGIPCYIHSSGVDGAYAIGAAQVAGAEARLFVPEDRLDECVALQQGMLDHI